MNDWTVERLANRVQDQAKIISQYQVELQTLQTINSNLQQDIKQITSQLLYNQMELQKKDRIIKTLTGAKTGAVVIWENINEKDQHRSG